MDVITKKQKVGELIQKDVLDSGQQYSRFFQERKGTCKKDKQKRGQMTSK